MELIQCVQINLFLKYNLVQGRVSLFAWGVSRQQVYTFHALLLTTVHQLYLLTSLVMLELLDFTWFALRRCSRLIFCRDSLCFAGHR